MLINEVIAMYEEYTFVLMKDGRKGFIVDKSTSKGLYLIEIGKEIITADDTMIQKQIKTAD